MSACCPSKLSNFLKVFCCMQTGTLLSSATVACQAALVQTASAGRRCSWGHPCPPESYPALSSTVHLLTGIRPPWCRVHQLGDAGDGAHCQVQG